MRTVTRADSAHLTYVLTFFFRPSRSLSRLPSVKAGPVGGCSTRWCSPGPGPCINMEASNTTSVHSFCAATRVISSADKRMPCFSHSLFLLNPVISTHVGYVETRCMHQPRCRGNRPSLLVCAAIHGSNPCNMLPLTERVCHVMWCMGVRVCAPRTLMCIAGLRPSSLGDRVYAGPVGDMPWPTWSPAYSPGPGQSSFVGRGPLTRSYIVKAGLLSLSADHKNQARTHAHMEQHACTAGAHRSGCLRVRQALRSK